MIHEGRASHPRRIVRHACRGTRLRAFSHFGSGVASLSRDHVAVSTAPVKSNLLYSSINRRVSGS